MAEDKRANPFQYPTREDCLNAPGTREEKAARFIVTRRMGGIPTKAFQMGDNDHSPVMQGVREFAGAVFAMLDAMENGTEAEFTAAHATVKDMLAEPVIHPLAVKAD